MDPDTPRPAGAGSAHSPPSLPDAWRAFLERTGLPVSSDEAAEAASSLRDALEERYASCSKPGWKGFLGFEHAKRRARGCAEAESHILAAETACRAWLVQSLALAASFPATERHADITSLTVMAERRGELLEEACARIGRLLAERRPGAPPQEGTPGWASALAARFRDARRPAAMAAASQARWEAITATGHARDAMLSALETHLRDCMYEGPLERALAEDRSRSSARHRESGETAMTPAPGF